MRPTHPVELICCALAMQEGDFGAPTNAPIEKNNPLDLRFAGQVGASAPGWNGQGSPPVATFDTLAHGIAAAFRQVWLWVAEGLTVRQIVTSREAPPNENDSAQYLTDVLSWTELPADTPVLELLPPLVRLSAAA